MSRRAPSHQVAVVELRRSNAAQPHRSKKLYTRTRKHAAGGWS